MSLVGGFSPRYRQTARSPMLFALFAPGPRKSGKPDLHARAKIRDPGLHDRIDWAPSQGVDNARVTSGAALAREPANVQSARDAGRQRGVLGGDPARTAAAGHRERAGESRLRPPAGA